MLASGKGVPQRPHMAALILASGMEIIGLCSGDTAKVSALLHSGIKKHLSNCTDKLHCLQVDTKVNGVPNEHLFLAQYEILFPVSSF